MIRYFELRVKFENGKFYTKLWQGVDGLEACQLYAAAHVGHSVHAWRNAERHGLFIGMPRHANF